MSNALELSYYSENKLNATFTFKVLKNLLDSLNKTKREEARYALLAYDEELEIYVELSYFKSEDDANYSRRKLRKITRLAFEKEFKLSVSALKEIELVK